jgi:deazaflavin-dependent oxidoreductase (nitroreductase family)
MARTEASGGVTAKSRAERILGRTLRAPGAALDRKGTRWLLQALSPATVIVLVHRGRRSGRLYKTPVEVLREDRERDEIAVSPLFGRDSDWYRNVVAGGLVEVHVGNEVRRVEWRDLDEAERRLTMDAYTAAHPRYSRLILRMLVRVNGLEGDPEEAVLRELPVLALRRVAS